MSLLPLMPRLSVQLTYPRALDTCQSCGQKAAEGMRLDYWQECDDHDRPQPVVVVLCKACGDKIIEPHTRLYRKMDPDEPMPGAMPCCIGCVYHSGLLCRSPELTSNGGPGLRLQFPKPTVAHVNMGRKAHQWLRQYHGPVKCDGRAVQ